MNVLEALVHVGWISRPVMARSNLENGSCRDEPAMRARTALMGARCVVLRV
jgi:hypothetical protein